MKPIQAGRLALALCALAACTMASACAPPPGPVDARGQEAVARDPAALLRIGAAADQAGDVDSAAAFYRKAADLRPGSATAQLALARALAEQGEMGKAIEALQAARAADPANPALTATLGRMLVLAHRPEAALLAFRNGLARAPGLPSLLIGQGVALDATGRHGEAQDSYRRVLAQDPDSVAARNDLALSLALSGRKEESIALLRRVLPASEGSSRSTVTDNLALVLGSSADQPAVPPRRAVARRGPAQASVQGRAQGGTALIPDNAGAVAVGGDEKPVELPAPVPVVPTPPAPTPPEPMPPEPEPTPEPVSNVEPALGSPTPS